MRFKYTRPKQQPATPNPTLTSKIYRPMKFLPPTAPDTAVTRYSGFARLENYLDNTKQTIADNLSIICRKFHHNLTQQERKSPQTAKSLTGTHNQTSRQEPRYRGHGHRTPVITSHSV